jgi:hypothetical protein
MMGSPATKFYLRRFKDDYERKEDPADSGL